MLVTPFISFINHNDYSYTAPEFGISLAILIAVGLLCAGVMMLGGAWLRMIGTAALITLFVDLQFDWFDVQREFRVPGFAIGVLLLCWLLRDHLSSVIAASFGTMLLASLVAPGGSEGAFSHSPALPAGAGTTSGSAPPAVAHLVLDEFIGIEGIPADVEGGPEVRNSLRSFFRANGFRVFGGAYSRFVRTKDAVPNALNYVSITENAHFVAGEEPHRLRENRYFSDMHRQGYRIHVYQPGHIDFCLGYEALVQSCRTIWSTGIQPLRILPLSSFMKAELVLKTFASLSVIEHELARYYTLLRRKALSVGYDLPSWWLENATLGSAGAMQVLDILAQDVAKARAGDLFFAHLMLPHAPYVYDRSCRLRDPRAWEEPTIGFELVNSPESRAQRYALYLEQIVCLQTKLQEMFDRWRQAGVYDRMKIVIHGDHGSRIYLNHPIIANKDRLVASDYVDGFSTLFAVKAPGLEPGYDARVVVIQDLLAAVAHGHLDRLPASRTEPYVLLPRSFDTTPHAMVPQPVPELLMPRHAAQMRLPRRGRRTSDPRGRRRKGGR